MTSSIEREDYDFESAVYRPEITYGTHAYNVDPRQMENFMKTDLGFRAHPISQVDAIHTVYEIDGVVRAKITSDAFRKEKAKHWEKVHEDTKQWSWVEGGMTGLLLAGTIATGILSSPLVATALGVATVAGLILTTYSISNTYEASRQIDGWKSSPLKKLAHERVRAYREGFAYVYNHDLKLYPDDLKLSGPSSHTAVLVPAEVLFLFDRYFKQFCEPLLTTREPTTDQGKKEWLDQFTHLNPVSQNALSYAHDGHMPIPEKYLRVSYDYEVLHSQLTDLRTEFNKLRDQRCDETRNIIRQIEYNRELALIPFKATLAYWENQALTERDTKLRQAESVEDVEEIQEAYRSEMRKYQVYYLAAIVPVNLYYDNQVNQARSSLERILEEINRNEANSHAPYFNYAKELLNYAWQVKNTPHFVYQPQPFTPDAVFQIPTPSAPPPEEINFMEDALHQRPPGMGDAEYVEYVRFVSHRPAQKTGT